MNPALTLCHVHGLAIGYARYGTCLAAELSSRGVSVYDHLESPDDDPDYTRQVLEMGHRPPPNGPTNVVCWVSVPTHGRGWWEGQHTVISTMWEAMELPESFRETLHEFDTVVVPSKQNVELFGQYHDNVHYVPLGVDPQVWHYTPTPEPGRHFNFLIAGSGPRKGTKLAYQAFRKVFAGHKSGPVPRLLMKNPRGESFHGPEIEVIPGRLTDAEEVALYSAAHCYLGPSRGEGFGLQPLQAMAQGTPTILTNAHGHASFAHLGIPLDWKAAPSEYFMYGHAGDWWEPDFDQLCDAMRWVYDNYEQALDNAKHSAEIISTEFVWARTADQFLDAVGDELAKPFSGNGVDWHQPTPRLYQVITNCDHYAEMAGRQLMFLKGQEYWEAADVKRILYEAGKLDPKCLTRYLRDGAGCADLGLSIEEVKDYMADAQWCPTCHQRMGSGISHSDEIFAEGEAAHA